MRCCQHVLCDFALLGREPFWPELECQLVDAAGKLKRQLVTIVHARAGIAADVEALIDGHQKRNRVLDRFPRQFLAIDSEYTGASLLSA